MIHRGSFSQCVAKKITPLYKHKIPPTHPPLSAYPANSHSRYNSSCTIVQDKDCHSRRIRNDEETFRIDRNFQLAIKIRGSRGIAFPLVLIFVVPPASSRV